MSEYGEMSPEQALQDVHATAEMWRKTCHERDLEIARLRAEVERLRLDCEAALEREKLAETREQEVLTQVAVLINTIRDYHRGERNWTSVEAIIEDLPAEAHALLDRLQKAQAMVRAAEALKRECYGIHDPEWVTCEVCGKKKLLNSNEPFPHTANCEVADVERALAAFRERA